MHRSKGFTPAKPAGFTLIELLVVIAIIAILAAGTKRVNQTYSGEGCGANTAWCYAN